MLGKRQLCSPSKVNSTKPNCREEGRGEGLFGKTGTGRRTIELRLIALNNVPLESY